MAQKSRRGRPRTDPDIVQAVAELARQGWSGPKIERKINDDPQFRDRGVSLKVVQNVMREARMPEIRTDADAWTVATASADEAQHVLPVLGCVMDETQGRVTRLRRDHAQWIARIRAALPEMEPWGVYVEAGQYVNAQERGSSTDGLDARLARRAWEPTARIKEAEGAAFARTPRGQAATFRQSRAAIRGLLSVPIGEVDEQMWPLVEAYRQQEEQNDG